MLTFYAYHDGKFQTLTDIGYVAEFITDLKTLIWIDAIDPDDNEIRSIADEFKLHPLTVDDYYTPHYRPKVVDFDEYCFIVAHSLRLNEDGTEVINDEIDMIVGKNFIITLHEKPIDLLAIVSAQWKKSPKMMTGGTGLLLYDIMDQMVDLYFPILDDIEDEIDDLENMIFNGDAGRSPENIFRLKRRLLMMHRTAAPLRDVFNDLTRREQDLFTSESITYLRNVYDHTLRIVDSIDTYRDILTGALDAYLTSISNQMNKVMKSLTVAATILMSIQIITGIYGMNLKIPETEWSLGYPFSLGLMTVISISLVYYFRKIKWI